jgi:hypothetical protein
MKGWGRETEKAEDNKRKDREKGARG